MPDQNISFRVGQLLSQTFQQVKHTRQLGWEDASDAEIWTFAFKNEFTIVNSNSDLIEIQITVDFRRKIIGLRFGNSSNLKIANKLILKSVDIRDFLSN